jgi:putative ABC transport system permease protein
MVSEELARTAGLSVGHTLSLSSFVQDKDRNRYDIGYELTIVGIYQDSTSEYTGGTNRNAYTNRRNEILTTFETVGASIPAGYTGARLAATYYLKSPELLDKFTREAYAKGLDPVYDVVYARN